MAERRWTQAQHDAIYADGGSLLVSAAAGSGKTAVLVERAVRLLTDERNPVAADRLLVMTFSRAAAAEMKQRMHARLSELVLENPGNVHLRQQQVLLDSAGIGTVHSFCIDLIRRNFQHLNVAPDFVVTDEQEMEILEHESVAACVEELYQADETGLFSELVDLVSTGRDDRKITEIIRSIYHFSRSHPFSDRWLEQAADAWETDRPTAQTPWGIIILQYAADCMQGCRDLLTEAIRIASEDAQIAAAYLPALESDLRQVEQCPVWRPHTEWDSLVKYIGDIRFVSLGRVKGESEQKTQVRDLRKRSRDLIESLQEKYLCASEAEFREDLRDLAPKIRLLFTAVQRFGQILWQAKAAKKRLDFSDLEHLALALLVEYQETGVVGRTPFALEIASRYDVIMVDEYQDTNEVQDLIFTSVSRMQENLFLVGDVKQSIYSFRQAMPEIFLTRREHAWPYDGVRFPARISLDVNFRSRYQVTEAVNFLFSMLMSREMGDMEYDESEQLKCGAQYPEHAGCAPELLLTDLSGMEEKKDALRAEADAVADRVARMLAEGFMVAENGQLRPARPRDFCILLRTRKDRTEVFVRALTARGIPAGAETGGSFLQQREVSGVIALLEALDNPLLDVELAAAMLSPLIAFTDDELARIRLCGRLEPLYRALLRAAQTDEKSAGFLELFRTLRSASASLPADRLLLRLYDLTDAFAVVRAMPAGNTRVTNLRLLVEHASACHRLGYRKLGGFVGFINRLRERGKDFEGAGTAGADQGADAVHIMSVHRSKGLEFPVVILADTAKQFNRTDLRNNYLLNSKLGFACMRRDHRQMTQFPSLPLQAMRLEAERSMLSEELRVLYVALTRAREKLLISTVFKRSPEKMLSSLCTGLQGDRLPHYSVRGANSYGDWILLALLHHPSAGLLRETARRSLELSAQGPAAWQISKTVPTNISEISTETEIEHFVLPDPVLVDEIDRRLSFQYPYMPQTLIPTKLAVSAAAKGVQAPDHRFTARPKVLSQTKMTPAERGNAMHKFMQFADYRMAADSLEQEIERMRMLRYLTDVETESLSRRELNAFFSGTLARRIFAAQQVQRELKFASECGRELLGEMLQGMGPEDRVVLQGVADCVFVEQGQAVIVDYKTDRVSSPEVLQDRYAQQLRLYRYLLSESLEVPVKECLIYSFALGYELSVDFI